MMPVVEHELYPFPDLELPAAEVLPDRTRYMDALVARLRGYRPLMLDIDIPHGHRPPPVIVWLHGGAWMWGTNKHLTEPFSTRDIRDKAVAVGFAFAAAQYRLSGEIAWPAQLHDVESAICWLRHYAAALRIDPDRIAAWGESAGGHLAAMLAATGRQIRAAVSWYGPADLTSPEIREPVLELLGGTLDLAVSASPVHQACPEAVPLLLMHGTADTVVPVSHSEALATAYSTAGAPADLVLVPGAGHAFAGADPGPLMGQTISWVRSACANVACSDAACNNGWRESVISGQTPTATGATHSTT